MLGGKVGIISSAFWAVSLLGKALVSKTRFLKVQILHGSLGLLIVMKLFKWLSTKTDHTGDKNMARITRSTGAGKPTEDKPAKKPAAKKKAASKKAKKVDAVEKVEAVEEVKAPAPAPVRHDRQGRPLPPR